MEDVFYTLARWRVKEGREAEFRRAWNDLGRVFLDLPGTPTAGGTLIQSVEDPLLFCSFGPWQSLEAIRAMRGSDTAREALARVSALCDEATPGAYRVVETLP